VAGAGLYVGGDGRRVVDIGAGTGRLAHAVLCANLWNPKQVRVTAVEFNPEYVRIGGRLLPEVEWIEGDFYDLTLWQSLPRFDEAISNPPFGKIVTTCDTA
jgi:predicted RNA methylase